CPGYIATPLAAGAPLGRDRDRSTHRVDKLRGFNDGAQPLHRSGEADDVANVALFLASDESEWMTGTAQVIDGGLTLGKPWRDLGPFITEHRPIRLYRPTADGTTSA
ncbi:MAG: SDR family oxidoreductase, partial [Acidimicrobiia bacterium]|nr:SDR family oxidoreductase [Acidimicrobiia bacterium]